MGHVDRLAHLVSFLMPCFQPRLTREPWNHIGALLADVCLQAALNYEWVVRPRVERIALNYGSFRTIQSLRSLLECVPIAEFLQIANKRKQRTFLDLIELCYLSQVDTIDDLKLWMKSTEAVPALFKIQGIGHKSVDYLRMLLGEDAFPIDRHMKFLVAVAGLDQCVTEYDDIRRLFELSCKELRVDIRATEVALWQLIRSC